MPECYYCITTKQTCPGYRDAFELVWRDQTSVAKNSDERRKRAVEKKWSLTNTYRTRKVPLSEADLLQGQDASLLVRISNDVPISILETHENYALAFFFSVYTNPPSLMDERCGYLEHVAP